MTRRVDPLKGAADGRLFWLDGFLRPTQCEAMLRELEFVFWSRSQVYLKGPNGAFRYIQSGKRVSQTSPEGWFSAVLKRRLATIDRRIGDLLPHFEQRREPWQATRYGRGGKFGLHHDAGYFFGEPAGERTHTVLLYLATPRRGGTTRFPRLGVDIEGVAGRLVVWVNLDGEGARDPDMVHAGMPVNEGTKTTLVTWMRQRDLEPERRIDHDTQAAQGADCEDREEARPDDRSAGEPRDDDRDPAHLRTHV